MSESRAMMSEVNGVFGNVRQCFVSLEYCASVQKLAPWTAGAGGLLGHHPHRLHSVEDSALDTPKGAEEVCRKSGGPYRENVFILRKIWGWEGEI